MHALLEKALSVLLPSACLLCNRDRSWNEPPVCLWCSSRLPFKPQWSDLGAKSGPSIPVFSLGAFDGSLRELIHAFKFDGKSYLACLLARWMVQIESFAELKVDGIVPVPMDPWREFRRGYNQVQLLSEELSIQMKVPVYLGLLARRFFSRSQINLDRREREQNARASYRTSMSRVNLAGQRILLIDDVVTTGATLRVCASKIATLGAVSVTVATIARDEL